MHLPVHMRVRAPECVCEFVCMRVYYVYVRGCVCIHVRVRECACVYVRVCARSCVRVCAPQMNSHFKEILFLHQHVSLHSIPLFST